MLPIFILRELGLSPASMGVIFSLGAVGGLVGAIATPHIVRRDRRGPRRSRSARSGSASSPIFLPLAALVPQIAFPLLVAQGFVVSFTVLLYNITQVTFRQRITPPRLLGRMNASVRFVRVGRDADRRAARRARSARGSAWCRRMWIGADRRAACSALFVIIGPFWSMRDLPDVGAGGLPLTRARPQDTRRLIAQALRVSAFGGIS